MDPDISFKETKSLVYSSYIVQTPSGVYSYWRSAVQELSTVDLKNLTKVYVQCSLKHPVLSIS